MRTTEEINKLALEYAVCREIDVNELEHLVKYQKGFIAGYLYARSDKSENKLNFDAKKK